MDQNTIIQIQKRFIQKKISFDVTKRYFANISSYDMNMSYRNVIFKNNGEGVDLHIGKLNSDNIDKSLKEQMSFNPLRWQEIAGLDFSYESIIGSTDDGRWYDDILGNELYNVLSEIYTKGILNRGLIEINMDKNRNYWILRNMFNIFKKICVTNAKDFRTAKYRDSIIIAMSEKFPEKVNPKNFGLVWVPESQPVDLFTKWYWERQSKRSGK